MHPGPSGSRRTVGYVGQPNPVRHSGIELAFKKIGRDRMRVAAVGGHRHAPPSPRWTDAFLLHEPGNRAFRDAKAAHPELSMDPRCTITPLALQEDRLDLSPKVFTPGSTFGPSGRGTLPSIVAAASDADDPTHEPDDALGRVGGDEREFRPYLFVAH